jgi:hypothetical protein
VIKMKIFILIGGVEEDRTPDLRIANATLSQLSYDPTRNLDHSADMHFQRISCRNSTPMATGPIYVENDTGKSLQIQIQASGMHIVENEYGTSLRLSAELISSFARELSNSHGISVPSR